MLKLVAYLSTFTVFYFATPISNAEDLSDISNIEIVNAQVSQTTYKGDEAILVEHKIKSNTGPEGRQGLMIWKDLDFADGSIELDLSSEIQANAPPQARGFVGLAFRVQGGNDYEAIYLRPTNGRADDQVRRNHSVQYISHPDFPWFDLRKNEPGKYETYVDLALGEWTKVKIEVEGTKVKLYVHGNEQPTLIINDLKRGETSGSVALYVGIGTNGYFKNIKVN